MNGLELIPQILLSEGIKNAVLPKVGFILERARVSFAVSRDFYYAERVHTNTKGALGIVLETKTVTMISALWERKRPLMLERLTTLDRAAEAAAVGSLGDSLCEEALSEAHKLAGSLGTFGFPQGTEIARELEVGLEEKSLNPERMRELTRRLREMLFPASVAN